MYNINVKNYSDDSLIHVFSSEGARGIGKYKKETESNKKRKLKKKTDKFEKDKSSTVEKSIIDIRC